MNRNLLALFVGMGVFAVSATAMAQEASVVEGPGYPVGEGTVIHPTLGAEIGVINNVFYEEQASNPHTSGILRLLAEASIASKEVTPEAEPDPFLDENEEAAAPPAPRRSSGEPAGGSRTTSTSRPPTSSARSAPCRPI
jgi:hypothetical protein